VEPHSSTAAINLVLISRLRQISDSNMDAIVGDWLSELNIAWNAIRKYDDPTKGYEVGFLEQLEESIDIIAKKKIKLVCNAGALNTPECTKQVKRICEHHGHGNLKVAFVEGDDISDIVVDPAKRSQLGGIVHLDHPEKSIEGWNNTPLCGVAYFGAWGIVEALREGADIVICGRVTDASPVIALAAWWHNWSHNAWNQLAGALIAGRMYHSTRQFPITRHKSMLTYRAQISLNADRTSRGPISRGLGHF
jgi:hypothetical protein